MTEANLCLPGIGLGSGSEIWWVTKFGDDGNVYYLYHGGSSMYVYICQIHQIVYFKYVQFSFILQ